MERRRQFIASTLVRKPNISQRQIRTVLAANGIVNPDTGEPYSLGTINADIKAIRQTWRQRRQQDAETWIDFELAKLDEIEEAAWRKEDLNSVFKAQARRDRYLGLSKRGLDLDEGEVVAIAIVRADVDAL